MKRISKIYSAAILVTAIFIGNSFYMETAAQAELLPVHQQQKRVRKLFTQFAKLKAFRAHFVEEKHLAILASALKTEGTIEYTAPQLLVRTTLRPKTKLTIKSDSLIYKDSVTEKDLPLGKDHPARAFVQVFLNIISGNFSAIEKSFRIDFSERGDTWSMMLHPKSKKTQDFVKSVQLSGSGIAFTTMTVVDRHGDRTVTHFRNTKTSLR